MENIHVRKFVRLNLSGPPRPSEEIPLEAGQRAQMSWRQGIEEMIEGEFFVLKTEPSVVPIYLRRKNCPVGYASSGFALQKLEGHQSDGATYKIVGPQ